MEILIADDDPTSRALLAGLARKLGHEVVLARDGVEAVRAFEAHQPDLVLIDGQMPGMDGYAATARIRELDALQWTPILFVAGEADNAAIVRALDAGADDYLVKPAHLAMLRAKLAAVDRVRTLHREAEAQKQCLQSYHDTAEQEGRIAAHLMKKLVNVEQLNDPMLDCHVVPMSTYSGDLVAAARTPGGTLHVMLADAVGHGLAAALNLLPLVPCFYSMTEKGFDIDMIAVEMNRTLRRYMPVDRFVATTLIAADPAARRVKVWNGGNPPVLALDDTGAAIARFTSRNLALGILPEAAFEPVVETFDYTASCQLFACSDGVVEDYGQTVDGTARQRRVEVLLRQAPPSLRLKLLRSELAARIGDGSVGDDMTVVLVRCDPAAARLQPTLPCMPAQWKFDATFDASDLRELDVVALLLKVISNVPGAHFHMRQLGVVVSELFANALDHGVLDLPSSLKDGDGGMERYSQARAEALAALEHGSVEVRIASVWRDGRPLLALQFRDSGAGFKPALVRELTGHERHGRGILLVRAFCASVDYHGAGNDVRAIYALDDAVPAAARKSA